MAARCWSKKSRLRASLNPIFLAFISSVCRMVHIPIPIFHNSIPTHTKHLGIQTKNQFGKPNAFRSCMNDTSYAQAYTAGLDRTIRFIISRGANREVAEETAQMAWTRAWERLHQLKDDSTILAWVNTIALNLYRRSFRRHLNFVPLEDMPVTGRLNVVALDLERLIRRCRPADQHVLIQQHAMA